MTLLQGNCFPLSLAVQTVCFVLSVQTGGRGDVEGVGVFAKGVCTPRVHVIFCSHGLGFV